VFKTVEYTEESYQQELEHIEEVFSKLVVKCKQLGRAMRIGTNHGSLSDRIMSYYGDSPAAWCVLRTYAVECSAVQSNTVPYITT